MRLNSRLFRLGFEVLGVEDVLGVSALLWCFF